MEAKTVQLSSQKIAYYESSGTGAAMLLVHGNSASGLTFKHQLDSALGEKYRLVAMDLPGHGDSDAVAGQSVYSIPGYAKVVAETAVALGLEDAVLLGWSLGGHIILEAHNLLPKAAGFMIYGTPPLAFPPAMEAAFLPNPAMGVGFTPEVNEEQATTFASAFMAPDSSVDLTPFVHDILRTDGNARGEMGASIPNGYQDEVDIVANLTRPLAILHGKEEQLVSEPYINALTMPTLWRNELQIVDGAGHATHWEQPKAFNGLLADFLEG